MEMRRGIYILLAFAALLVFSCKAEPAYPETSEEPLTSISAFLTLDGEEVEFKGIPDEAGDVMVKIPYYYPESGDNAVPEEALKKVRIRAYLVNNATIENPSFYMDLTQENTIVVIDQVKARREYRIRGSIVRSSACDILSFIIPITLSDSEEGVITGTDITFATDRNLDGRIAKVELSPHATISPDPRVKKLNFNEDIQFTVTADDGTTKVYTSHRKARSILVKGIREGSAKVLFAKKLYEDLGIDVFDVTGGIAVSGDNLVVNTRDRNSAVIDRYTGENKGPLDLGAAKGPVKNFYTTSDDEGVMLLCNLTPNDGNELIIWKIKDVDSAPVEFLRWDAGGRAFGRKMSIAGSLSSDAVITIPENRSWGEWNEPTVAKWVVKGGELVSATPELMLISGYGVGWDLNADAVCMGSEEKSDYLVVSYNQCIVQWVDGKTNSVKASLDPLFTDYVPNAIDFMEFNGTRFYAFNQTCAWDWDDKGDCIWMIQLDDDGDFRGAPDAKTRPTPSGTETPGIKWFNKGTYGSCAITLAKGNLDPNHPVNGNCTGDVQLAASDDGVYLYLYFMFTNGSVVGVQFDCLNI